MNYSVAIVAIARLENPYINEWISYHHALGFSHFYIYDNACGNEVHIDQVLTDDNAKVTTVIPVYNKVAYQKSAYNDAYARFNQNHDYMLFIDIDEFFTLCKHKDVSEYIDFLNGKCPGFQQVKINWEVYDDNNAIERDISIPVHEFFIQRSSTRTGISWGKVTKCLIKTDVEGLCFFNVHYAMSRKHQLTTCNSNGEKIYVKNQMVDMKGFELAAKIRHYATKTISEYMNQKLKRGDADGYIVRNIENRFFILCSKTNEKYKYYTMNKYGLGCVDNVKEQHMNKFNFH